MVKRTKKINKCSKMATKKKSVKVMSGGFFKGKPSYKPMPKYSNPKNLRNPKNPKNPKKTTSSRMNKNNYMKPLITHIQEQPEYIKLADDKKNNIMKLIRKESREIEKNVLTGKLNTPLGTNTDKLITFYEDKIKKYIESPKAYQITGKYPFTKGQIIKKIQNVDEIRDEINSLKNSINKQKEQIKENPINQRVHIQYTIRQIMPEYILFQKTLNDGDIPNDKKADMATKLLVFLKQRDIIYRDNINKQNLTTSLNREMGRIYNKAKTEIMKDTGKNGIRTINITSTGESSRNLGNLRTNSSV
jgi:hypothetical protein